jgi:hypothetical protein
VLCYVVCCVELCGCFGRRPRGVGTATAGLSGWSLIKTVVIVSSCHVCRPLVCTYDGVSHVAEEEEELDDHPRATRVD